MQRRKPKVIEQESKAWIFVSHSSKDIRKVRTVRDALERAGAHPILFFLKAVEHEHELRSLLRREIDARNFFLLCRSRNASDSRWVQEEVKYVSTLGKIYSEIDLEQPVSRQVAQLRELLQKATVFVLSDGADAPRVERIKKVLLANDYAVFAAALEMTAFEMAATDPGMQLVDAGAVVIFRSRFARTDGTSQNDMWRGLVPKRARIIVVDLDPFEADAAGSGAHIVINWTDFESSMRRLLKLLGLDRPGGPLDGRD